MPLFTVAHRTRMAAVLPSPTLTRAKALYRRIYGGFGIAVRAAPDRRQE